MLRLTYLDIQGIAEPIRLALTLSGAVFEDRRVTYSDVNDMRVSGHLPFGQVPILEYSSTLNDGADGDAASNVVVVSQSCAILRYIGRRYDMLGPNTEASQQFLDIALAALAEIQATLIPAWYGHACGRSPRTGQLFEATKLTTEQQSAVLEALNEDILPARFRALDKLYAAHEAAHHSIAAGCQDMTIADVLLFSLVTQLADPVEPFCKGITAATVENMLIECGTIRALVDTMAASPHVQAYTQGRWQGRGAA